MRVELMPSDVLETLLEFLTGFDAFVLCHVSHVWFLYLSNPIFWQNRLHGAAADVEGPPWMKDLKGSATRLKRRMKTIVQREKDQQWKKKYIQERSLLFRGMGSHELMYRRQRGPYAYLEHNVLTESRHQRPMAYLTGNHSLSFDVWFCLLPVKTSTGKKSYGKYAGGVIYGFDCDDLEDDRWQPVVVDSKCNLYCSLLNRRTAVAATLDTNRWHHVALTYDLEKQYEQVYVDGVNVHSAAGLRRREWSRMSYQQIGTGHIIAGDGDFPYPGYSGAYDFRGLIDEFRVWHGALSSREIQELAGGGPLPYREVWASMKLSGRRITGVDLEWVRCTRPAEHGVVVIQRGGS
ncbi:hypothetical protein PHMEG_00024906 [Phytophthora megakarya]|uniref:F-box domain-containing protein n=1 Tax=Phytophthora megakarya TaxID=4795 RepID=A0A225VF07_9STRA|nr:hypothetical protein PHMEG_00024906 [Phytophthora megakarya]